MKHLPEIELLLKLAQDQNNSITYDQLNDVLPKHIISSDKIDELFVLLSKENINIIDHLEGEEEEEEKEATLPEEKDECEDKRVINSETYIHVDDTYSIKDSSIEQNGIVTMFSSRIIKDVHLTEIHGFALEGNKDKHISSQVVNSI